MQKLGIGQILAIIAFCAPIGWGGIDAYFQIRSNTEDIKEIKRKLSNQELIKKQEELLKRFGEVGRLETK
jgi:hypothetical protein